MPDPFPDPSPATPAEDVLRAALEQAQSGDREALPALRSALDDHPEVWERFGDLAAHAEQSWIELIGGPDLALAECLARKVAGLKAELSGPFPSPLERLLVGRVAATWLQVHHADAAVAQAGAVGLKQAELALKRQARAHKGYLMAIAALATIRRLLPAVSSPAGVSRAPRRIEVDDIIDDAREQAPAGTGVVAPGADDDVRYPGTAGHGALALFDRSDSTQGRGVDSGRIRGRSAS